MVEEGQVLWRPSPEWMADSNLAAYQAWLKETRGLEFESFGELQRWSVTELDDFWASVWDYFEVKASAPYDAVLGERGMPGAEWFPGARLNYAENIFKDADPAATALLYAREGEKLRGMTWAELDRNVRCLAQWLKGQGVEPGDRVAAYLPNCPQAVVAILATASVGAIWAAVSPDFGTPSVLDRFAQLDPKVLLYVDGYHYGGKPFDKLADVREIVSSLPTLEKLVLVPYLDPANEDARLDGAVTLDEALLDGAASVEEFAFEQVPFQHPLWVLFSSGTTGIPKAIVHSHGGIILEQLKLNGLHNNMKPGQRQFFYTTLGWMMWNYMVSALLLKVVPVFYDGNPNYPDGTALWRLVEESGATLFGASPTFVQMQQNAGIVPREQFDLDNLTSIMLAGSPVSAECTGWFYEAVKDDLWLMPGSGGTDICSGFVGAAPGLPVIAGEIQAAHLGVDAAAFDDDGKPVINEVGELVIRQPMPSMPLYFWGDDNSERYLDTYFDTFPGIWRHGDFFMLNERGGCFVLGRSDATLNRYGIRIGTAEIYRAMEMVEEVDDSLIVNLDLPGGRFFMPMFVTLADGAELTDELTAKIGATLRRAYTPRHVPDKIYAIDSIPYTLTGKKMEVPVRKILMGWPLEKAANPSVMSDPRALDYFVRFAEEQSDYSLEAKA